MILMPYILGAMRRWRFIGWKSIHPGETDKSLKQTRPPAVKHYWVIKRSYRDVGSGWEVYLKVYK